MSLKEQATDPKNHTFVRTSYTTISLALSPAKSYGRFQTSQVLLFNFLSAIFMLWSSGVYEQFFSAQGYMGSLLHGTGAARGEQGS